MQSTLGARSAGANARAHALHGIYVARGSDPEHRVSDTIFQGRIADRGAAQGEDLVNAIVDTVAPVQIKDLVYLKLRDALIAHEFAPGESMREVVLSERYGVSKTPIREALVRLEQDGLVDIAPYRGARARTYSPDDARELFEAREILESECVRLAAGEPDVIARLRANVAGTRDALDAQDLAAASAALDEFDDILFSVLRNNLLSEVIERLSLHLRRLGRLGAGQHRFEVSLEQHERIVAALVAGDPDGAREVLRAHLASIGAAQAASLAQLAAAEQ
jgi:DNA-binding GntR family transcriptional regulator